MAESGGASPGKMHPRGEGCRADWTNSGRSRGTPAKQTEEIPASRTGKGRSPIHTARKPGRKRTQGRPRLQASRQRKERPQRGEKPGLPGKDAQGFPTKDAALSRKKGYAPSRNRQRPSEKQAALFPKTCSTFRKKRQGNTQKVLGEFLVSPRAFYRKAQGTGRCAQRLSTETWSNSARPPCSEAGKSPVNPTQTCGGNGISTE